MDECPMCGSIVEGMECSCSQEQPESSPPTEIDKHGTKRWRDEAGRYHREDGPAIEWANGTKYWYFQGKFHREDGPAIEWANGYKAWWTHGKFIRQEKP